MLYEVITRAVDQVSSIADETSQGMGTASEAVQNLAELAERLKHMMHEMLEA